MGRYSKSNSNYIFQKRHQTINGASIIERDWVTIGGRYNFGKGKRPIYDYGNFIFTRNNIPSTQKKFRLNSTLDTFNYTDVENASPLVNTVVVNQSSDDIRDFAYYGSCVELVRTSIENIIANFPAVITSGREELEYPNGNGAYGTLKEFGYIIKNPFQIDLYHDNVTISKYDNYLRYMSLSYQDYLLNGVEFKWEITKIDIDKECPQNDQWYIKQAPIIIVKIGNVTLNGFKVNDDIIFTSNEYFVLKPKQEIIDDYFNNLNGFEKQLLRTDTKPLYKNSFITPIEGKLNYKYVKRDYIWPSNNDYCIDIESPSYFTFFENLLKMAQTYDELWADNLYRNMTHEAIKNFDWTYTRSYAEGEEQDNIDGGQRMEKILRVYGRVLDDVKRYADGIRISNRMNYSVYNTMPDAMISESLENMGWDVISTIQAKDNINITKEYIDSYFLKWYKSGNYEQINVINNDISFMKRLMLSSKRIMQTKGTKNSIDMVMAMFGFGDTDYTIFEEYATVTPITYDDNFQDITDLNYDKTISRYDEDELSGLPLKVIYDKINQPFIVPYYDMEKQYDGDLYYQSKGGWGKQIKIGDEITTDTSGFDYKETLSYLRVVPDVASMLDINSNSLNDGDVVYVIDLGDYINYNENTDDLDKLTHYFGVNDASSSSSFAAWTNLSEDNQKVKYLESIVSTNIANNPHVGYGRYDVGREFFEYMKMPFKYAVDNKYFYDTSNSVSKAEKIKFDVTFNFTNNKGDDEKIQNLIGKDINPYYLNSKVLILQNNIKNDLYKEYFMNVILYYVMQVIPSTAILVLKGFDIEADWELISRICETNEDGSYTGDAIATYQDINEKSSTYGQTRTEIIENAPECYVEPVIDDDPLWEIESTECELDINENNTGYLKIIERDINPDSPSYNTTQERKEYDIISCPLPSTEPNWIITSQECETDENGNTGYLITIETDTNPYSSTYNETRETKSYDVDTCPLPQPIDTGAVWEVISQTCEVDENNENTGNLITVEQDVNPYSETYGETRESTSYDVDKCPLPIPEIVVFDGTVAQEIKADGYRLTLSGDVDSTVTPYLQDSTGVLNNWDYWIHRNIPNEAILNFTYSDPDRLIKLRFEPCDSLDKVTIYKSEATMEVQETIVNQGFPSITEKTLPDETYMTIEFTNGHKVNVYLRRTL